MAAKDIKRAFGEEIRDRRLAKNISQEELAERAGLHRNFIGSVERGAASPTLVSIVALATALKAQLPELIGAVERRWK